MESLNSYISDGESNSSINMTVSKKAGEEVDANCEPITMDMSEESSGDQSEDETREKKKRVKPRRRYSKSLSPSPPTSCSSDSSEVLRKRKNDRSPKQFKSDAKEKRFDKRGKCDDGDWDGRRENRKDRSKNSDRHSSRRHERKRSHRSRSRSSSYSRNRSRKYKYKSRTRSRSRSYDRHPRRSSPRRSPGRRKSPYGSRRSRSRSHSREKPRSHDWKSSSKLKVLEKLGIELRVPAGVIDSPGGASNASGRSGSVTAQMLLQKSMEHQVEKVKSTTGISLPSYYNPMAINPAKYAEQIQKRKLLWGNKEKPVKNTPVEPTKVSNSAEKQNSGTIWQGATFGGDQDGKMTAKFQRLMGIKNANQAAVPEAKGDGSDLIKKQEEMFNSMESQYEVARLATHSHRGLGLGFGTFQPK